MLDAHFTRLDTGRSDLIVAAGDGAAGPDPQATASNAANAVIRPRGSGMLIVPHYCQA
jgi:hypothetical protein